MILFSKRRTKRDAALFYFRPAWKKPILVAFIFDTVFVFVSRIVADFPMNRTHFYDLHKQLGAKVIPFAGFDMPVNYSKGILAEHNAVRTAVGMFDVSHMGEVEIRGADALAFIQHITINDASKLTHGKAQYSAMCYDNGGIVDDLLVYHCGDHYMLVINASNIEKDIDWMKQHTSGFHDLELKNVSDEVSLLAVQGPKSITTLQKLTTAHLADVPYYSFVMGTLAGVEMILSRTGYTGEIGFELYFKGNHYASATVWNAIMDAGSEFGIEPIGLGARDTLRLEKGYCLYGNDIDQTTHPLEAGLGWITKLSKENFVGKDVLVKAKEVGVGRKLVGMQLQQEKIIPRPHYKVFANGQHTGEITSGSISPVLNKGIALGYVNSEQSQLGTIVHIEVRGKEYPAEVVKLPFV